jgi:hypothetical protein
LNDREYFYLRAHELLEEADSTVIAIPICDKRPAYVINLNRPVPRFRDPQAVGGLVASSEWLWREEIRSQLQSMMDLCPLVLIFEKQRYGLAAVAATQEEYKNSRGVAVEKWEAKRREEQAREQQVQRQQYFWERGRRLGVS